MADLRIEDVHKQYSGFHAIRGVDVEMRDGEFVALVGPSGCGKSTLLRMIAGLESITSGRIILGGRVLNDLAPKDRDIAMVFQNYALYPHMTVAENLGFSLKLRHAPKAEFDSAVRKAADLLGLTELLDRYPGQLSGGQRQRVAMGRAIVREPKAFLFDEPLSNLDAKLRVQMRVEIKALHERLGTTIVYVTHDQVEAMTMADRIVVMRDGIVEQAGPPLDLYDRPANRFVAGFLGSPPMGFLEGQLAGGELALADGTRVPLGSSTPPGLSGGEEVVLGVRPEHIGISAEGVPARVIAVEPTGADTHLTVSVGSQPLVVVVHDRVAARPGETIRLQFRSEALRYFRMSDGLAMTAGPGAADPGPAKPRVDAA